ncbi:MAG: bifunctional folylpolyglutamate synthase/dihydrofolate synthase, partial [Pyrinomonadaceae bacterium]|nr:bifunctional folylpolyglutamate synthase/dihydrofolate synthase [Pyrinomonadaceae bacterium]
MNFQESIDYLFGLGYELSVKKFGLENTYTLLEALGNPQNSFIKIQVAGTNGKGSTCAFLESILVQAGIAVGVNTSPHLISVTERVRKNGNDISEERFAKYVTKVRRISAELVRQGKLQGMPTFFEHITCIAQLYFADEEVEVAILETGLGGRFDATTATEAEIVAITPIALDHTKTLGDTIEKIALEKAAIIRGGVRAVIADQNEAALEVILSKCEEHEIKPTFTGSIKAEGSGDRLSFETPVDTYKSVTLGLAGKHQVENAKTAVLLAETLRDFDFEISTRDVETGLQLAVHKGRLEYADGILYDGAHNVSGAKALREYLETSVDQPITMVFAAMGGKDLSEMSSVLFPLTRHIVFTTPENPRARPAQETARFVSDHVKPKNVFVIDDVGKAFEKARDLSGGNGLILVTGSLYLIGEIKAYLQ